MDYRDSAAQAAFRSDVRAFIQEHAPAPEVLANDSAAALRRWRDALRVRGWVAAAWPRSAGGGGLSVWEQAILNEELAAGGAPPLDDFGLVMVGPILISHGTEEQRRRHLPPMLAGEVVWCQGYSEPGAGSDLAALQTRAVRNGDHFLLNGQKIWTTGAHNASWCFCLARTNPDVPRHRGITYLLVDMRSPGVSVRPIQNLAGTHRFNEVFFDDVVVPVEHVVGEVDRGWYVGASSLDVERSSIGTSVANLKNLRQYIGWFRAEGKATSCSPAARLELAARAIECHVATEFSRQIISLQAAGRSPNHEASVAKLLNSELRQRIEGTAMRLLATAGLRLDGGAPLEGVVARRYLGAVAATIAGGTSEIQRNIIATRGLGLPR